MVNVDDDEDSPIIQRAHNKIVRALHSFRRINPVLSDQNITIGFCIKQFRSMAPSFISVYLVAFYDASFVFLFPDSGPVHTSDTES